MAGILRVRKHPQEGQSLTKLGEHLRVRNCTQYILLYCTTYFIIHSSMGAAQASHISPNPRAAV